MEKWKSLALLKGLTVLMNRVVKRDFTIVSVFLLIGFSCVEIREPPNILFIAIDDLRPELGCYGVDYVKSPNIDKLASEGIVYNKAYCSVSWCAPSRTSLMTGMRPSATGVMDLKTHFRDKIAGAVTMSQFFKNQGYTAVGFGKIFHNDPRMQDDLSWSEPCWIPPGPSPIQAYAKEVNQAFALTNSGLKSTATERADVPDNAYPDGQVTDQARAALRQLKSAGKPFFLSVGYYKPHLPFTAPSKYWNLYDRDSISISENNEMPSNASSYMFRSWSEPGSYFDIDEQEPYSDSLSRRLKHGYLACVSFVDAQVGKLFNELERLDLADNTIIVVWGDHGWKLGEHGRWSKHSNMEIDTRVPLIIKVPGHKSKVVDHVVETIDIYPTLVKLSGYTIPENLHGEDLFSKSRNYALSQIPRDSVIGHAIRTNDFRYIEWREANDEILSRELYDHRENDSESVNIIDDPDADKINSELAAKLIF